MMRDKTMKDNNKGLSLVEIIVAIAIGSIVLTAVMLLVVQGVKSYRSQSTKASLQNDANIALNQMSDNIMEGDRLTISNLTNAEGAIYTSYFMIKDNVYYVYVPDEKILYLSESPTKDTKSSVLCENVEGFDVHILDYCIVEGKNNEIMGVTNPIQIKVSINVAKLGESREVNRILSMRNDLPEIKLMIEGADAESTDDNIIGKNISSIRNYITSEN